MVKTIYLLEINILYFPKIIFCAQIEQDLWIDTPQNYTWIMPIVEF